MSADEWAWVSLVLAWVCFLLKLENVSLRRHVEEEDSK